jgi:Virulence factor
VTRFHILYWQDVPSLVRVFADDGSFVSRQLPDWFQHEIDNRAMEQGLVGSDAYLEQWRWGEVLERPEPADELIQALVAEFQTSAPGSDVPG